MNRDDRGFAVIEAIISLAILSVVSISLLAYFSADLRAASQITELLPATMLAEHRMSYLEVASLEELTALPDSIARGRFAPPYSMYEWTADAEPVFDEPGLYDVQVVVRWPEGGMFTLQSRIYRPVPMIMAEVGMTTTP